MKDSENLKYFQNKIVERRGQNTPDRLMEMLTGVAKENFELVDRLEADKQTIRVKYNLPDEDMRRGNPGEYYWRLNKIAEENNLKIRPKEWDEQFFIDNDVTAKFEPDTSTIVVDLDDQSERKYRVGLKSLEHELIHGLQVARYPNMPIEVMEYEAYVASAPIEMMKKSSLVKELRVFKFELTGSVFNWYKRQGRMPEWDTPEWFLENVDKINGVEKEFVDLDDVNRSAFVWNRVTDKFDQMLDYLVQLDRNSDEEKLNRRLLFDRKNVREWCGLPIWVGDYNEEYLGQLKRLCQEKGIVIGNEDDYQNKYGKKLNSNGYCDEHEPLIFVNYEMTNGKGVKTLIKAIEHEYVHARQVIDGKMASHSPEQNEYEALVAANLNPFLLKEDPVLAVDYIAAGMIGSVSNWYQRRGIKPFWR